MSSERVEFWENFYQDVDRDWGTRPNVVLVDLLDELQLPAGTAMDLGSGHGGDAVWLASNGWRVSAVDVSTTALARVAAAAERAGVSDRVTTTQSDLESEVPSGTFDLVYAAYFHSPVETSRFDALRRAAQNVAPGGILALIDHGSGPSWSQHDHDHYQFLTPDETIAGLALGDGWDVVKVGASDRIMTGPEGQTGTVIDNVIVVRRSAASAD
ncbi:methyltransferase family protein [Antricoccus suffuscus]|uniref:Methyltransferase family protein n=1 Tax=Antricoccus suffuscus TaxID=1629062 RepID=A0A2T1A1F8_9ACTN|nr:class I SAM-dependent methyltransferase [Antricoccus suffuscus]PRZ42441.1 methyltransferase family protein [Antricoccus suffuscus]